MNLRTLQPAMQQTGVSLSASWCAVDQSKQSYLDHAPKAETSGFATRIRTLNPEVGT